MKTQTSGNVGVSFFVFMVVDICGKVLVMIFVFQ